MGRKLLSKKARRKALIASGNHFGLYSFTTKIGGPRELLCRLSQQTVACKALPLVIDQDLANKISLRGRVSVRSFAEAVHTFKLYESAKIPLLACDRPLTYFAGRNRVKHNWIYELPGGVVEDAEHFSIGGIREMLEELGIANDQVLCYCCLAEPAAFDSGSHAEWVGLVAAICTGTISPPNAEGIKQKQCTTVKLGKVERFIAKAHQRGIGTEGYIEACTNKLNSEVLKHVLSL